MESTVVFSPSGRFACRQGLRTLAKCTEQNHAFHIIDFQEYAYYEFIAESYPDYIITCLYWLDENHIAAIYMQSADDVGSFFCRKRILYEVNFYKRKLDIIRKVEWNMPVSETRYLYYCEGTLTLDEKEYLVFADDICTMNKKAGISLFRFIPKHFEQAEIPHEKAVINWMKAADAVSLDYDGIAGCTVVALKSKLYFLVNGIQVIAMDMQVYFASVRETDEPPDYEEFCSKIVIPMEERICRRPFLQNGSFFLITVDRNDYESHYLKICDFEGNLTSCTYKINGILNSKEINEEAAIPNLFVHQSGQIVQFQHYTFEFQNAEPNGVKQCQMVHRRNYIINFCSTELVLIENASVTYLTREYQLLCRLLDAAKIPRCVVNGTNLLSLPFQKLNLQQSGLKNFTRKFKTFFNSFFVDVNNKHKI